MAKLTKGEWHDIRSLWESDPKLTFGYLAAKYGLTKQTIYSRSKKENWKRRGNLADINREAVRRADALTGSVKADEKTDDREKADGTPLLKDDIGFDAAADLRANIQVKHRRQIVDLDQMQSEAMSLFAGAMEARITPDNASDDQRVKAAKNLWWQAKICADILKDHCAAIKIKHGAERVTWGMDTLDLSPADLESFSEKELDDFCLSGKLPLRFRKIFSGFSNDR